MSDFKDPKVKAWIINCCMNGLKIDIKNPDDLHEFSCLLAKFLSQEYEEIFAHGDEDGIICENNNNLFALITIRPTLIKFSMLGASQDLIEASYLDMGHVVLGTIGFSTLWHAKHSLKAVQPASGVIPGGEEYVTEWEDDGFGIS